MPPEDVVNQPSKVKPALSGEPGDDEMEPPVDVDPSSTALPPCSS